MRKIFILLGSLAIIPTFLMLTAYNGEVNRANDGNWENSGSPGDGADCSACHSGSVTTNNAWLTTNIPSNGYIAGQTYTLSITTSGGAAATKKGFSIACENSSNTDVGTFLVTDATNTVFFMDHVSQTATGNGMTSWSFDWTAPASGSGEITFYSSCVYDGYSGGVVNSSASFVEATTGINDFAIDYQISTYPNPTTDVLNVKIPGLENQLVQVSIFSITGQQVFASEMFASNLMNRSFDVSEYESGIYIIKISGDHGMVSKRFIVQ